MLPIIFKYSNSQIDNFSSSWIDISFLEMMKTFESIATFDMSAVGFRPWSQTLPACISRGEVSSVNFFKLHLQDLENLIFHLKNKKLHVFVQ